MRKEVCIYFTGLTNGVCEKGINYRATAPGADLGWATRIPCDNRKSGKCDLFKAPTEQEIKEDRERTERMTNGLTEAIKIIREKTNADPDFNEVMGDKKGCNGFIDCPICGHPLHYSVSPGNNHIWGECSSGGCLAWMM